MAYSPETKKMILDFLRDNPQLSSYQAADALFDLGIRITYRTIAEYRNKHNIYFDRHTSLHKLIKADLDAGIVMTSKQIMEKYKCCRSHANLSLRKAKELPPERKKNKLVVIAESKHIDPVPVNSMAFYIQQLCA